MDVIIAVPIQMRYNIILRGVGARQCRAPTGVPHVNENRCMSLCDRVWVLAEGQNLADGTPAEIQTNPKVLEAYLGK